MACFVCAPLFSASSHPDENLETILKIKTAYLFNIAKFVEWPQSGSQIRLCLSKHSPLYRYVQQLNGRVLSKDASIRVVTDESDMDGCHIHYLEKGKQKQLAGGDIKGSGYTLFVSDYPYTAAPFPVIQLFVEDQKVRFSIDMEQVGAYSYKISSNLLRLARTPRKDGSGGER